jgi:hypothetical protein
MIHDPDARYQEVQRRLMEERQQAAAAIRYRHSRSGQLAGFLRILDPIPPPLQPRSVRRGRPSQPDASVSVRWRHEPPVCHGSRCQPFGPLPPLARRRFAS